MRDDSASGAEWRQPAAGRAEALLDRALVRLIPTATHARVVGSYSGYTLRVQNHHMAHRWLLGLLLLSAAASRVAAQPAQVNSTTAAGTSWVSSATADVFQLPPKTVFDKAMPRYPNAWFYVDRTLATTYKAAVELVARHVRERMRAREYFGPFDNPEGCDFEVRIEHLQPWEPREPRDQRPLTHAHAFHLRYYYSPLGAQGLDTVTVRTPAGPRDFYRVAASVHYEVEHANPLHADVEACPFCGRTGDYRDLKGNLVEQVHDPLGLELLLTGSIRGEPVRFDDYEQRLVSGIKAPADRFTLDSVVFPGQTGDRNTLRVGVIVFTARTP